MTQQKPKITKKNNRDIKSLFKKVVLVSILGIFFIIGISAGLVAALVHDDPVRSQQEIMDKINSNNLTGTAYFSNENENGEKELIGMLRADEDRRFIEYEEMPQYFIDAVVAIEDSSFWEHKGINPKALTRAILQDILNSDVQTGGSTITQQLAKNTFYTFDKSYERKAKEIFLALRIERFMDKEDIFTAYANKIPFGKAANLNNVYGIQAAAKGYFNKDAKDLNLAESAFLAGIPQRPTAYSSFNSSGFDEEGYNLAIDRQKLVLRRMLEEGYITVEEHDEALAYDIKAAFDTSLTQKKAYNKYPYLMLEIENRSAEILLESTDFSEKSSEDYRTALENAKRELLTGGYKVYTTIDKDVYEAMNSVAQNPDNFNKPISYNFTYSNGTTELKENQLEQVGATLVDNKTGAILGFVGGRDFSISQVNHSNFRGTSKRQPGSAIKPLLDYAPALELGKIQPATPIDDTPLGKDWEPENWNRKYNGRITAREALNWSYNIPAVKVYEMVGTDQAYEYFTKLGFDVDKKWFTQAGLTPAIGTIESSPEEMTNAYTTFANGGIYTEAYLIEKIVDKDGNVIYEHQPKSHVVFSEQTSYLMIDMMRTVVSSGTGSTVKRYVSDRDIAGKTGTTNDSKDLWFVGSTPELTLGVWVGYDYPHKISDSNIAKKTWGRMLSEVLNTKPELSPKGSKFEQPDGLVRMEVSSTSGKLPSDLTREAGYLVTDWFNKKYIPTEIDDSLEKARVVYYNGVRYLAKPETPDEFVQTEILFKREPYEVPAGRSKPVDHDKELPNQVDPRVTSGETPAPPNNIVFKSQNTKNIISWDKNTKDAVVGYRIYRSSSFGFEKVGVSVQQNSNPERVYFEDSTNNQYVYYVTTVYVDGSESAPSEMAGNFQTLPGNDPGDNPGNDDSNDEPENNNGDNHSTTSVPSSPKGITSETSALTVLLSWDSNKTEDMVTSYNIYYSANKNGEFKLIGSTDKTSYLHTNVTFDDAYYYITAVNAIGESEPSKVLHVKK